MKRATCSDTARRTARGFTLIEMLVAITLLAVMAVIAWQGLDAMTRGRERMLEHDARLDALKLLYGQFQTDCEHLADADALQSLPAEVGAGQLLLVRDRREEGAPASWQVVVYRLDGGRVVRAATGPLFDRGAVLASRIALRQAAIAGGGTGGGANAIHVRSLLDGADDLTSRAWVEPGGWMIDNGAVQAALRLGGTGASAALAGLPSGAIRGLELVVAARLGDGAAPRRFEKLCMTGR